MLHPEEARWLRDVFSRIDVARAEIQEAHYEREDMAFDLRNHTERRVREVVARHCEDEVDLTIEPRTDEDKGRGFTRLRGALTIIRGGLPPRPAF
jgi:hypothetical protein